VGFCPCSPCSARVVEGPRDSARNAGQLADLRDYHARLPKRASEVQKKRTAAVEATAKAEFVL
jgi:hypothetical protein